MRRWAEIWTGASWMIASWASVAVALALGGVAGGCGKSEPAAGDGATAAVSADVGAAAKAGPAQDAGAATPKPTANAAQAEEDAGNGVQEADAGQAPAGPNPVEVAERYLRLGAEGDLAKVKALVDPACYGDPVGDVAAVKMLGVRMKLTEVGAKPVARKGSSMRVAVTVKGDVEAAEARTETNILGKPVTLKAAGLSMKGISKAQVLDLAKLDGRWVVTCHAAMSARAAAKKKAAEEAKAQAKDEAKAKAKATDDAKGGGAGPDKGAEPAPKAQ